jgi:hypothetical protein
MPTPTPLMEGPRRGDHREEHYTSHRVGWLRAAVLGANDGIVSTASLIVGVAAASGRAEVLIAGGSGPCCGRLINGGGRICFGLISGRYGGRRHRAGKGGTGRDPQEELKASSRRSMWIAGCRAGTGPAGGRASLHAKSDPLAAHVRDELGISEHTEAQPLVAALASALTFAVGAALPLATAALVPEAQISLWVTVLSLAVSGVLGRRRRRCRGGSDRRGACG